MAMKTKLVPISEVFDFASGMNMFEVTQTFTNRLDKCELMRYINAVEKVAIKEVLNKKRECVCFCVCVCERELKCEICEILNQGHTMLNMLVLIFCLNHTLHLILYHLTK